MQYEYRHLTCYEREFCPDIHEIGLVACARRVVGEEQWWLHFVSQDDLSNILWID